MNACPVIQPKSSCRFFNSDDGGVTDNGCVVTSASEWGTNCNCPLVVQSISPSSSVTSYSQSSNFAQSSSSASQFSFVSMKVDKILTTNELSSDVSYNSTSLSESSIALQTLLSTWFVLILILLIDYFSEFTIKDEKNISHVSTTSSLPRIFTSLPFKEKLKIETFRYHRWISILTFHDQKAASTSTRSSFIRKGSRRWNILRLAISINSVLFFQSVVITAGSSSYALCSVYMSEHDCLLHKAVYVNEIPACEWKRYENHNGNPPVRSAGVCSESPLSENYIAIIAITALSSGLGFLLTSSTSFIISRTLTYSTASASSPTASYASSKYNAASVAARSSTISASYARSEDQVHHVSFARLSSVHPAEVSQLTTEVAAIETIIQRHLNTLTGEEKLRLRG